MLLFKTSRHGVVPECTWPRGRPLGIGEVTRTVRFWWWGCWRALPRHSDDGYQIGNSGGQLPRQRFESFPNAASMDKNNFGVEEPTVQGAQQCQFFLCSPPSFQWMLKQSGCREWSVDLLAGRRWKMKRKRNQTSVWPQCTLRYCNIEVDYQHKNYRCVNTAIFWQH